MSNWTHFPSDLADRCVKCAQCLPVCPTWRLSGEESESPRGRVALMLAAAGGLVPTDRSVIRHLDQCVQCGYCEPACPAEVPYRALIVASRSVTAAAARAPWRARLLRWFVARPAVFNAVVVPLLRLWSHLPAIRHPLLPRNAPRAPVPGVYPPTGRPNGETVGLFLGCVARATDGATLTAALTALRGVGYAVEIPEHQTCCGALHGHAGDALTAAMLARRNNAVFDVARPVVSCASGCAPTLRASLDAAVVDVAGLLPAGRPPRTGVVLHIPCTQATAGDAEAAAALLPGARRVGGSCCGAAGEYLLQQPAIAARLRDEVLDAVGDATVLCTSNVGCAMHLRAGARARGTRARGTRLTVVHPVVEWARANRTTD
ncbi:MAG: heterodisulfide reductase-related iron-sulfur binding cluster [Gammaproteobacteria bacterium]